MVANYDSIAAHGINKYLWYQIVQNLGWVEVNENPPIFHPQQTPEALASNKPHIVYTYAWVPNGESWFLKREQIAYVFYSPNVGDIRRVINLTSDYLDRYDWTAQNINTYLSTNGTAENKKYDYKTIRVRSGGGAEPTETEGGWYTAHIIIECTYTYTTLVTEGSGTRA